ncbi:ribosome biogenesis GTPase Der [Alphaproteobacteria bacterium]|nr:ribosome biogenesis GTPase Der [Alphaproteobacteria bacterium]MDC1022962.1 ribosome biogenesis GTPase Der [Alphaproteobacteria bacterium]
MFKIVLVGRPNVGKSTLFNRLVGYGKAIVNDQPGVTRDRKYGKASIVDLNFILIDTAGIDDSLTGNTEKEIKIQTEIAIQEADLIIFVVDGRAGVLPTEKTFSRHLIKINKPVVVLVNKCEGSKGMLGLTESNSLGFETVIPFSAEHGEGLSDLYDVLRIRIENENEIYTNLEKNINIQKQNSTLIRMGIIGRPNTGKSTLINNLIGQRRLVTGSHAGITRDAIEVSWSYNNQSFCLIDTAGLRKKARINDLLEKSMVGDTLKTIKYSNICILLIDANIGLDKQDLTIARVIVGEGRGLIIGANMWDKVINREQARQKIFDQLEKSLSQIKNIRVIFMSGLQRQGLDKLMDTSLDIKKRLDIRISTGKLNRWLIPIIESNPAPLYKGKRNRIRYITQVNVRPPTFAVFMSSPENLPDSYKRFLMSSLMNDFDLSGLPIRIMLRKGNNPYVES